jgi:hypothetical protein
MRTRYGVVCLALAASLALTTPVLTAGGKQVKRKPGTRTVGKEVVVWRQ